MQAGLWICLHQHEHCSSALFWASGWLVSHKGTSFYCWEEAGMSMDEYEYEELAEV